jgi:hypothetical protein
MVLIVAAMVALLVALLVASGLVSAGSRMPLADPTPTVGVFLTNVYRLWMPSDLKIDSIWPYGPEERVYIGEYSEASQDMAGWRLHSVVGDQWYDFVADEPVCYGIEIVSGPDAECEVLTPWSIHYIPPGCYVWTLQSVWNDAGDIAVLYNASGQVVDEYCYGLFVII